MANATTLQKRPFGIRDKVGYMFGDFGNDFTFMLSSMFMMVFYTNVMGIDAAVVGTLMMVARFVDAVTDVTMGQIVDRSKPTKDGKFKPWIRRCCGPLGLSAFLMFQSGFADASYTFKVVWMFATYILWGSIFYTSVNIPYGSMASAISNNPDERGQLSSFRSTGATLASIVIGTVTPLVAYTTNEHGAKVLSGSRMTVIAGIFAVCGICCHLACFYLCTERVEIPQNKTKLNVGKMLKSLVTNRALLGIILAAIFLLLGMLGMSGMSPYIFPTYYGNTTAQSMLSLIYGIATIIIVAPFVAKVSKKIGKKETAIIGCAVCVATWIVCLIVRPESGWGFVAFYVIAYLALNFFNYIVWAMIVDVIDDAEVRNGIREDGTIYSVYSFARKIGQALSSGMIGALLTAIGFTNVVSTNPAQYPDVLSSMFNLACLIPAIGMGLVIVSLVFVYPLNKKKVDENARILKERREAKAK